MARKLKVICLLTPYSFKIKRIYKVCSFISFCLVVKQSYSSLSSYSTHMWFDNLNHFTDNPQWIRVISWTLRSYQLSLILMLTFGLNVSISVAFNCSWKLFLGCVKTCSPWMALKHSLVTLSACQQLLNLLSASKWFPLFTLISCTLFF